MSENGSKAPHVCYPAISGSTTTLAEAEDIMNADFLVLLNSTLVNQQMFKLDNWRYLGTGQLCGSPVIVWRAPCWDYGVCYATVQPWDDTVVRSMTNDPGTWLEAAVSQTAR